MYETDAVFGVSLVDQPSRSKDGILQGESLAVEGDEVNLRNSELFLELIGKQKLNPQKVEVRGSSLIVHQDGNVEIAQGAFLPAGRGAKLVGRSDKRVNPK